uniref:USP domain-containing protein n=1 Tax=Neogobius melanostomus TaxID=47308 RepID=A0A8C6WXS2_9GOBI
MKLVSIVFSWVSQKILPYPSAKPHPLYEAINSSLQSLHFPLQFVALKQGATCYLNSVLQVLFMTREILESLERKKDLNETEMSLRDLFDKLKTEECGTESITQILDIKDVHGPRDAAQYLKFLLNRMSTEVSKVSVWLLLNIFALPNSSLVSLLFVLQPFCGKIKDLTECSKCSNNGVNESEFFILPLPLSDSSSVVGLTLLSRFTVHCSLSDITSLFQSCEITECPDILVLLVKRLAKKVSMKVELSETIELKTGTEYSLSGIVDHMGKGKGHYTATLESEDGLWYCFNDTNVTPVFCKSVQSSGEYCSLQNRQNISSWSIKQAFCVRQGN